MVNSMWQSPEFLGIVTALIISLVSGSISIGQRILRGQPPSILWVFTEYLTAILCGVLMYWTYPEIEHLLPEGFNRIVMVAVVAHSGGRVIQEIEKNFIDRWSLKKK